MKLLFTLTTKSRFQDVKFYLSETLGELLLIGCEDGKVRIYNLSTAGDDEMKPELIAELIGSKSRYVSTF